MAGRRDLPTGTVTFFFSDIEGSARLLERAGGDGYGRLLSRHDELLHEAVAGPGGIPMDRQGDALFAVFASAGAALAGAVAAQRALAAEPWPEEEEVRVRIGLHTGEASLGEDGYVGTAVHQAPRVADLGHGGQILLSRTTAALVEHELPDGIGLRDLGDHPLAGLDRPERVFQAVVDGLETDFPPLGARQLAPPQAAGPALLERESELATIHSHVEAAARGAGRLTVIEGRAGIGKSRLLAEGRSAASEAGLAVLTARGG